MQMPGMRKKSKVDDSVEKFSNMRSIDAISRADVCLILIDANEGVTEQDTKIAGLVHEAGKAAMIVVNKWDAVSKDTHTMADEAGLYYLQGLRQVSFQLSPGESAALIGANGAGKTTLLLSLVGLLNARGEIRVDGLTLCDKNLPQIRQRVGVVFQNPDDQLFLPTVYQNVAFGLENMGLSGAEVQDRTDKTLERLGILPLRDRQAQRLSGGEKRMAALATVLAMEPKILLLDEPTAFLDPKARRRLIQVMATLDQTMLVVTHDLTFALETCKRSIVLTDGAVFADGPSRELLFDETLMENGGVEAIRAYG